MRRPIRLTALATGLLAFAIVVAPAQGGLGDKLKQKATSALKGDKAKPAAASESGPITSRMNPPLTAERLARFQKGMQVELAEREKARKFLASLKTKEAYRQCTQEAAMSPEMQKIAMSVAEMPENATTEQMQKHMARMGTQMESLTVKKCGQDPSKFDARQMDHEAFVKGMDTAALSDGDDYAYQNYKEWILEFCNYLEKVRKQPDAEQQIARMRDEGLRIPGQGTGIYWVYTASEVAMLMDWCPKLKQLIEATI